MTRTCALRFVAVETRSLLARLLQVRPLSTTVPMVPAAAISPMALRAIDAHLRLRRRSLRRDLSAFLVRLGDPSRHAVPASTLQQQFVGMRMRVLAELTQLDIFADAVTQRSEHRHGVWLAGLDALADDAMRLPLVPLRRPPVVCYLDRGYGAAIRRAATRLPGGGYSPIAIVRVPRERMVGSGVASSIVHEVGHQVAALLDLVPAVQAHLRRQGSALSGPLRGALRWWGLWLSELVPDLWAVARLGVVATRGLIGVVSLPEARVFHIRSDDPHPPPWLRVLASCAFGQALYPHRGWSCLARTWVELYPLESAQPPVHARLQALLRALPTLIRMVLAVRPAALDGLDLRSVLRDPSRQPRALEATFAAWRANPRRMRITGPSLAIAVLGHAVQTGALQSDQEAPIVTSLLQRWAVDRADGLDPESPCPRRLGDHRVAVASSGVTSDIPLSA